MKVCQNYVSDDVEVKGEFQRAFSVLERFDRVKLTYDCRHQMWRQKSMVGMTDFREFDHSRSAYLIE